MQTIEDSEKAKRFVKAQYERVRIAKLRLRRIHDCVPDEKTAERIAEAVLVGQFGQERVNAQLLLHTASTSEDAWLVQGAVRDKEDRTQVGGGFGVWVNKHTGCVTVMERMK